MVQVSVDQVIGVVPVRHGFVAAARTVSMHGVVPAAAMLRRAAIGVGRAHLDDVLVHVIFMRVMEMTIMKIVDVAVVSNRGVTTA
jgi:hypothetical protein